MTIDILKELTIVMCAVVATCQICLSGIAKYKYDPTYEEYFNQEQ